MGEVGWTGNREGEKNEGAGVLLGILWFYFARFVLFRGRQSSHRSVIWVMILVCLFYFILFILLNCFGHRESSYWTHHRTFSLSKAVGGKGEAGSSQLPINSIS